MANLWILTEERPKKEVLKKILKITQEELRAQKNLEVSCNFERDFKILPILRDNKFSFKYKLEYINCTNIENIFIKIVQGRSSFVDFLIFYQEKEPNVEDKPLFIVEETKTDDSESRNTGIYQRAAKFVYANFFYPDVPKYMVYNLRIAQKEKPTDTNIFGSRCFSTLGIKIIGKSINHKIIKPFSSIEEVIELKNSMRPPPQGNIPIKITKETDSIIKISGRLFKKGLNHDPNIGALSLIAATLRKLGWKGKIIITHHGLQQKHLNPKNKFIRIANQLDISLEGLEIPESDTKLDYWKYSTNHEKLATIFLHISIEEFSHGKIIFENHGGCEKGYFYTYEGEPLALEKYEDRLAYKSGDKDKKIEIPDMIILDCEENIIINIEGKKSKTLEKGLMEIEKYDAIENLYIKKYYPTFKVIRKLVIFGNADDINREKVAFVLTNNGELLVNEKTPNIIKEAIENLKRYFY